jgi:3-deoxy-D-manno-octulosonate 8-phosphate phosphatase (KDO 8-P phosphatase)
MGIKDIKLLLTDVDGVLTDGKVYVCVREELVRFDIQDGIGHRLAVYGGLKVGWLSGRLSQPVALRAKRLKVHFLYQGQLDKLTVAKNLCRKEGIGLSGMAYLGDDLIDMPLLSQAGWSATVPYGRPEVKRAVHYVAQRPAGEGAFREVVEKILKAQHRWEQAVKRFHQTNGHKAVNSNDVFTRSNV